MSRISHDFIAGLLQEKVSAMNVCFIFKSDKAENVLVLLFTRVYSLDEQIKAGGQAKDYS